MLAGAEPLVPNQGPLARLMGLGDGGEAGVLAQNIRRYRERTEQSQRCRMRGTLLDSIDGEALCNPTVMQHGHPITKLQHG